jgi:7-cyano-7-deazaguanine synthase in queuosine biosynthesis
MSARPAVVLLSGGLDSTTVLAIASNEGFAINALSFRYGQRHGVELDAAREIAQRAGVNRHPQLPSGWRRRVLHANRRRQSELPLCNWRSSGSAVRLPVTTTRFTFI